MPGSRAWCGAMVALVVAGFTLAGDCDVKTTEPCLYCEKCEKVLEKADVQAGKCSSCKTPAKRAELCVKKTKDGVDKCLVIYVCEGCGAKSPVKTGLKHEPEKDKAAKKKTVKRTCEKSGTAPHATGK